MYTNKANAPIPSQVWVTASTRMGEGPKSSVTVVTPSHTGTMLGMSSFLSPFPILRKSDRWRNILSFFHVFVLDKENAVPRLLLGIRGLL